MNLLVNKASYPITLPLTTGAEIRLSPREKVKLPTEWLFKDKEGKFILPAMIVTLELN